MWRHVRRIEQQHVRYLLNGRKYGQVRENLQMYVDEQVFRYMNRSSARKCEALCNSFHVDNYRDYEKTKDKELGIGGGYTQFGILTEEEFLEVLKSNGKKMKKFYETPGDFKQRYYADTTSISAFRRDFTKGFIAKEDEDSSDEEKKEEEGVKIDVEQVAKERFNYDEGEERRKDEAVRVRGERVKGGSILDELLRPD